jgi:hypothetical protein
MNHMGVRERLNDNPRVAVGVAAAILVVTCTVVALQFSGASTGEPSASAFFTTDDGQTWFVDDATKLAPFQRDGKEAVRAYVFECNGTPFVNHLERFTPDGRKAAEAAIGAKGSEQATPVAGQLRLSGAEIKKPGAKQWTPLSDMSKAGPILRPKCPNGTDEPKPLEP